jgi:spermidine synthase
VSATQLRLLFLAFFLSGAAGLSLQILWSQQLSLLLGAAELAAVAVLASFMGGMALGSLIAARLVSRLARPVLAYACLEALTGLWAWQMPRLLAGISDFQLAFLASETPAELHIHLFAVAAAAFLLLPPCTLMGATTPLLLAASIRTEREILPRAGALYGANALGACGAAAISGLFLLPLWGQKASLAFSLACAVSACLLATLAGLLKPGQRPESPPAPTQAARLPRALAWTTLTFGFLCFAHEVYWLRLLTLLVGSSLRSYATMLAIFLAGISLGAWLCSLLGRSEHSVRTLLLLALAATVPFAWSAFLWIDRLPLLFRSLAHPLAQTGLVLSILLPLSTAFGMGLPLLSRLALSDFRKAGDSGGRLLAWNTLGCLLGCLTTGTVLLPNLGLRGCLALMLVLQTLLLAFWLRGRRRIFALALLPTLLLLPSPNRLLRYHAPSGSFHPGRLLGTFVGRTSTCVLLDQGDAYLLLGNGLPESAVQKEGNPPAVYRSTHFMTLLPQALRSKADRYLMVGFGAGVQLEYLPAIVEQVDVVELEPAVLAACRSIPQRHPDPLADPRLRLIHQDARSYLRLCGDYEVILSQPSHPWTPGSAQLFTLEWFQLVANALGEQGIFVQWVGLSHMNRQALAAVMAAMTETFPHVAAFLPPPGGSLLLLGGKKPLTWREDFMMDADWHRLGFTCRQDLGATQALDDLSWRSLLASKEPNRDENNIFYASSGRGRGLGDKGFWQWLGPLDPLPETARETPYLAELCALWYGRWRNCPEAAAPPALLQRAEKALRYGESNGEPNGKPFNGLVAEEELLALRPPQPGADFAQTLLLRDRFLRQGEDPTTATLLEERLARHPSAEFWLMRATLAARRGDPAVFVVSLLRAMQNGARASELAAIIEKLPDSSPLQQAAGMEVVRHWLPQLPP